MKKYFATLLTSALLTSPVSAEESWTGFYIGAQVGAAKFTREIFGDDDSTTIYGIHTGVDIDTGRFIAGFEVDYDTADYTIGGASDTFKTLRLKFRPGYDAGKVKVFGVVGALRLAATGVDVTGTTVGFGAAYKASDHIILGVEYLRDAFDAGGNDFHTDLLTFRASYKF